MCNVHLCNGIQFRYYLLSEYARPGENGIRWATSLHSPKWHALEMNFDKEDARERKKNL